MIAVVWTYRGLSPDDMAGRVIYYYERQLSTAVNDIEHIESQSLTGIGIVKIFFRPGVDIRTATAQVTSLSQTVLKQMPPGITPPLILNYNASTVPILQLALSSPELPEQTAFRPGPEFHPAVAGLRGGRRPCPRPMAARSGRSRSTSIRKALQADNLSAEDVENAHCGAEPDHPGRHDQNGPVRIQCETQRQPGVVDELNDLPIKTVNGSTIYMRDVAHVRDGAPAADATSCAWTAAAPC